MGTARRPCHLRVVALMCTIAVRTPGFLSITQTETLHNASGLSECSLECGGTLPTAEDRVLEAGIYSCLIPVLQTVHGPRSVLPCRAVLFHRIPFRSSLSVALAGLAVSSSIRMYSLWYLPCSFRHEMSTNPAKSSHIRVDVRTQQPSFILESAFGSTCFLA